ncbi:MAG: hypothetical protein E7Z86_05260 [Methanosphaera stadtmanae]|jgi:hypothetical protein|nr:hypothetical protein [Methanosphaera stadtmanae]
MSLCIDYNLKNLLDVIQIPLYNSLMNKNKVSNPEIINSIDLNITNFNKYFPLISSILKNNDNYKSDLLYDFMEVRLMSSYIFDKLDEITTKVFVDIDPFLDTIYENLLFVDYILDDFHNILNIKNEYINKNISKEEYTMAYNRYKLKLDENTKIFYDKYYDESNNESNEKIVKKIMPLGFADK